MPKVLNDPRGAILRAVRDNIESEGWAALNIRLIAKRAGVAQGTIYNYFESTSAITAELLCTDWEDVASCAAEFKGRPEAAERNLAILYRKLTDFMAVYKKFWSGDGLASGKANYPHMGEQNRRFLAQLEKIVTIALGGRKPVKGVSAKYLRSFLAMALMYASRDLDHDYKSLSAVIRSLLAEDS